jgi:hypothetical protein
VKHCVQCEAAYNLEKETTDMSKQEIMFAMIQNLQDQFAKMAARVAVLEERKARTVQTYTFWKNMTPKQAWTRRKENAVRLLRVNLSTGDRDCKYYRNNWEWLEWLGIPDFKLCDILSFALWPVLEDRKEGHCVLQGIQTNDHYSIFKQIWGKKEPANLDFWEEALLEIGVPEHLRSKFFNRQKMRENNDEFQRIVKGFQLASGRYNPEFPCVPLLGLMRVWNKVYAQLDSEFALAKSVRHDAPYQWEEWGL